MEIKTGAGIKATSPYQKNKQGNKESSYRRKILSIFLKRDNSICRVCNEKAWNVHHVLPKRDFPHWKQEPCNLISLCFACHNQADAGDLTIDFLFNLIPN